MKKRIALFVVVLCFLMSHAALSDTNDFGLGIMLGEPTGFSGKLWWDDDVAIDGGIAWSIVDDKSFHVQGDVVWHNWSILENAFDMEDGDGQLPLYYGVGLRLKIGDETRDGVRFVVGASYIFEDAPFDVFLELVPIMDFAPKTELQMNFTIGSRFWF